MRKLATALGVLLGLASVAGATAPASAAAHKTTPTRHCVTNLDTRRTVCADDQQRARLLSDAGITTLTIAIFYDGTGYTGATHTWVQSRQCTATYDAEWQWADLGDIGWDNRVSSVHTYNQCDVKFYGGINFTGASSTWIDQSSNLSLIGDGWNNRASSVKFS